MIPVGTDEGSQSNSHTHGTRKVYRFAAAGLDIHTSIKVIERGLCPQGQQEIPALTRAVRERCRLGR